MVLLGLRGLNPCKKTSWLIRLEIPSQNAKAARALLLHICVYVRGGARAGYFFPWLASTTPAGRGQDYVQYARRGWMEMDATGR